LRRRPRIVDNDVGPKTKDRRPRIVNDDNGSTKIGLDKLVRLPRTVDQAGPFDQTRPEESSLEELSYPSSCTQKKAGKDP